MQVPLKFLIQQVKNLAQTCSAKVESHAKWAPKNIFFFNNLPRKPEPLFHGKLKHGDGNQNNVG